MGTNKTPLTIEAALKIQRDQLNDWQAVLKPKVFTALKTWVTRYNTHPLVKDGYDICRGSEMDNFVKTWLCGNTPLSNFEYKHKL